MRGNNDPFILRHNAKKVKESQISYAGQSREVSEAWLVGRGASLWLGKVISSKKIKLYFFLLVALFFVLGGRLVFLQFYKGKDFRALAEGNRLRLEAITPSRGIFFDRFGNPLVENIPSFSLFLNISEFKSHPESQAGIIDVLKELSLPQEEIDTLLDKESYLPIAVKESLSYDEAVKLKLDIADLSALDLVVDQQRNYQSASALAHLFGYTSRIGPDEKDEYLAKGYQLTEKIGRSGLEVYYQDQLRGIPGKREIEVDSLGREMKVIAEQPPVNGDNIFLSIDGELQSAVYQALKKYIPNQAGAVVAMDPRNGKVRAFASWPTFDNNLFSQGISVDQYKSLAENPLKPLFNRVITGEYPSGSTIKLVVGLAGLEEDLITKSSWVLSNGGVWYDKWFFPDWKAGGHGYVNIIKALAESVNTFFYYLALEDFDGHQGLGLDKMTDYFRKFGLGNVLGIDLYGESSGFIPTREWKKETKGEIWYPGDTLHLAIGQGDILVTPLQVASYTSAIANGGTLYRPELVEKIVSSEDDQQEIIEPEIIKSNLSRKSNINIITEGMREAVTSGSARGIYGLTVKAAGKTGTAQAGVNENNHAWFTGFLPYESPELVLTVLVEHGGEGSEIAVPIAREIFQWYEKNRLNLSE